MLALLGQDVADLPFAYLERAVGEWVRNSRFMPKASELVALCQSYLDRDRPPPGYSGAVAATYNSRIDGDGNRRRLRWIGEGATLRLVHEDDPAFTAPEGD